MSRAQEGKHSATSRELKSSVAESGQPIKRIIGQLIIPRFVRSLETNAVVTGSCFEVKISLSAEYQ